MQWTKREIDIFYKSFRLFRSLHYGGLVFAGGMLALVIIHQEPIDTLTEELTGTLFFELFLASLSLIFAFLALNLFNTFTDVNNGMVKDEFSEALSILTFRQWYILAWVYCLVSILLSLFLSLHIVFLLCSYYLIGIIYFVPPFRLKRWYPLSTFLLGLAAVLCILVGFSTVTGRTVEAVPIPVRFLTIILITMTLSFATKDRKDLARDAASGIKTIYTWLGEDRGRKINAIIVFISYCLIPLLLQAPIFFIYALPAALASALVTWSRENYSEQRIFIIYFIFSLFFFGTLLLKYPALLT